MRRLPGIIALLCLPALAMAQFVAAYKTDVAYPVALVDETDGFTPETEKKFGDTTITYCNITDSNAPASYTDDATTWKEVGNTTGEYKVVIGASEFTNTGDRYMVKIVVAGCRTVRFWVDTRKVDPNLTATTTAGKTIPIDGNDLVETTNSDPCQVLTLDEFKDSMKEGWTEMGYTVALAANLSSAYLLGDMYGMVVDINEALGEPNNLTIAQDLADIDTYIRAYTGASTTITAGDIAAISDAVWDELVTAHTTRWSTAWVLKSLMGGL